MLAETSGQDITAIDGVLFTEYGARKQPGWRVRWVQILHILSRPVSLTVSAHYARCFNECLTVDPEQLAAGLDMIERGDRILWFNPSLALRAVIEGLRNRGVLVYLYFVDPVHRLGLTPDCVRSWASWARLATYSTNEAERLGIEFLVPYAPAFAAACRPTDLDIVYVGSPTPRRLGWVLYLQSRLRARGRKGYLRLASGSTRVVEWFPSVFSPRITFMHYAELCARSRGVLELHERDAGGVTLRATLCQSLGVAHLSNRQTTLQTVMLSIWDLGAFERFLDCAAGDNASAISPSPHLAAPPLDAWLRANFG